MSWAVAFTGRSKKQAEKLPDKIREVLFQLSRKSSIVVLSVETGLIIQNFQTTNIIAI